MSEHIIRYDDNKRIVFEYTPDLKITYKYFYRGNLRLIEIESPLNKTNYKTILLEKKNANDEYVKLKKIEIGEKYKTTEKYDKKGIKIIYYKRFNKIKNTFYTEIIIRNKLGIPIFWFEERNENKNFGFNIKQEILKLFTFKK